MKKAFTLIELLIVMSVISILIGIVIPSFRGMQDESRITKANAECDTIQAAIESYYKNYDSFPSALSYLVNVTPKIISTDQLPPDPFRTVPNYAYKVGAAAYVIAAYTYATGSDVTYGDWYMVGSKGADRTWGAGTTYGGGSWFISGDDIVATNANTRKQ